jgi:hypothetical protein
MWLLGTHLGGKIFVKRFAIVSETVKGFWLDDGRKYSRLPPTVPFDGELRYGYFPSREATTMKKPKTLPKLRVIVLGILVFSKYLLYLVE